MQFTPAQLDKIILAIKPRIRELGFTKAIHAEMRRFGYGGDSQLYDQIKHEMQRRAASKKRAKNISTVDSTQADQLAAEEAKRLIKQAMIDSPEIDDIDYNYYIDLACGKYGADEAAVASIVYASPI